MNKYLIILAFILLAFAPFVLPILFNYGLTTGVYMKGWFNNLGWSSLHGSRNVGIEWILPQLTATEKNNIKYSLPYFKYFMISDVYWCFFSI